jgi:methionyl-tRNA formyltransferase
LRIIFMGTPEFAVPCLKMLVYEGYDIAAVVSQPDKPKGRGNKVTPPPVAEFAATKGLLLMQPQKIKTGSFAEDLRNLKPDLFVTVAYGRILPQDILDIPTYGSINVHASLLPKYRGAAPIQHAVINGETVTGITTMFMDAGMDTGDILLKEEVAISEDMTAGELHDKLSVLGADVLKETIEKLKDGSLVRVPQNHAEATYAPMLDKDTGRIDWSASARSINNLVRGTNPWPVAYGFYENKKIKIWKSSVDNIENECKVMDKVGKIIYAGKDGIKVSCGTGVLVIKELQAESSRRMTVAEYLCGHKIETVEFFE